MAIGIARDALGTLLLRSVELSPIGEGSIEDYAWALLVADDLFMNGRYQKEITAEIVERAIVSPQQLELLLAKRSRLPELKLSKEVIDADSALAYLEEHLVCRRMKSFSHSLAIETGMATNF